MSLLIILAVALPQAWGAPSTGIVCQGVYATQKWCDPAASISDRVHDMIARMPLNEKIARSLCDSVCRTHCLTPAAYLSFTA